MSSRLVASALWLGGAMLFVWILAVQNWSVLGPALIGAGSGVLLITAFHLVPMIADTRAWQCLLATEPGCPAFARLLRMRWLGESVNTLLPAVQVGGDLLRGRLAQLAGLDGAFAAASVLVNLTLTVATLLVFILLGIFGAAAGGSAALTGALTAGVAVGLLALGGFFLVQRTGLLGRALGVLGGLFSGAALNRLAAPGASLNQAIGELYGRHAVVARSATWSLLAWIAGAGEVWLALHFLGVDAGWREALILESLIQGIRNAAFMVPAALGVQEGGIMLLGPLAGIGPEAALLVSLLKRIRELGLGLPGLAVVYSLASDLWRGSAGAAEN